MHWIWIDRILQLQRGEKAVAVKNVSAGEDVLHDHFPATEHHPAAPVMPNPLIIEGMAQTAGILVGHARDYQEKVILAKVGKAVFHTFAGPGWTIRHTATLDRVDDSGAATTGQSELVDPATGQAQPLADISLMFSHIDHNRAGRAFPEHNFVFTEQFFELIDRSGFGTGSE
jgi:3-hydroxyacyl-[acyl-carrier-protein] dehydratase